MKSLIEIAQMFQDKLYCGISLAITRVYIGAGEKLPLWIQSPEELSRV